MATLGLQLEDLEQLQGGANRRHGLLSPILAARARSWTWMRENFMTTWWAKLVTHSKDSTSQKCHSTTTSLACLLLHLVSYQVSCIKLARSSFKAQLQTANYNCVVSLTSWTTFTNSSHQIVGGGETKALNLTVERARSLESDQPETFALYKKLEKESFNSF